MDEGSALLHHLERGVNQQLTRLALGTALPAPPDDPGPPHTPTRGLQRRPCLVVGARADLVRGVRAQLTAPRFMTSPTRLPMRTAIFTDPPDELPCPGRLCVVCESREWCDVTAMTRACRWIRYAQAARASLVVVMVENEPTPAADQSSNGCSPLGGGQVAAPPCSTHRAVASETIRLYPEFQYVCNRKLMVGMKERQGELSIDSTTSCLLETWIAGQAKDMSVFPEHMVYRDIGQILCREAQQCVPNLDIFLRLSLLCVWGVLSVMLTLIVLIALSKESGLNVNIRKSRDHLRQFLLAQRSGKSEWGFPDNALALTALQLENPNWCFEGLDNQRSVDRMEISLLAALSKLRSTSSRDLTPIQLAMHVTALVTTFQNPRDFHEHNLVTMLQKYLLHVEPYLGVSDGFVYGQYVIALCNAGVRPEPWVLQRLLRRQRQDGGFPLGVDETAMVVIALSCFPHDAGKRGPLFAALGHLDQRRAPDGSYGTLLATALTIQAFNASGRPLDGRHSERTLTWMLRQLDTDPALKTVVVATHVLVVLAGKTVLDVPRMMADGPTNSLVVTTSGPTQPPSIGKHFHTYRYMRPAGMKVAINRRHESSLDHLTQAAAQEEAGPPPPEPEDHLVIKPVIQDTPDASLSDVIKNSELNAVQDEVGGEVDQSEEGNSALVGEDQESVSDSVRDLERFAAIPANIPVGERHRVKVLESTVDRTARKTWKQSKFYPAKDEDSDDDDDDDDDVVDDGGVKVVDDVMISNVHSEQSNSSVPKTNRPVLNKKRKYCSRNLDFLHTVLFQCHAM